MKVSNTSERLKQIMQERNLRQVDILRMSRQFCEKYGVKLGKNDLSQYVNGKVEPGQDKLAILGLALDLNEAWLMGYDVSRNRKRVHQIQSDDIVESTDFEVSDDIIKEELLFLPKASRPIARCVESYGYEIKPRGNSDVVIIDKRSHIKWRFDANIFAPISGEKLKDSVDRILNGLEDFEFSQLIEKYRALSASDRQIVDLILNRSQNKS